jgi:hypothetical protein
MVTTALFKDGTLQHFHIHGEGFDPRPGEVFLFEFPEGVLKEGTIRFEEDVPGETILDGVFDAASRTIAVEV